MRPGVAVSVVGHAGAILMTMLVWQAHTTLAPIGTAVVPVEIVDVGPESNVRALSDVNTPEGEEQADEAREAEPEPAPASAATPPPPQRRQQNAPFDLNSIPALLNHDRDPGQRRTQGAASDRNQQGVGLGTEDRVTLEARAAALVQAQMRRCWRMPADLPDPERLVVILEFDINRNGTLNGQPRVISPPPGSYSFDQPMRAAVDAAQRAVRVCDPYPFADDPVVGDHYEIWRTNRYRFALGQH